MELIEKKLRKDDRIDMFTETDYSEGTAAYVWICNKVRSLRRSSRSNDRVRGVEFIPFRYI